MADTVKRPTYDGLLLENEGQWISESEKVRNRKRYKRRSAIESVIGHLKSDFRMARNFLKGSVGDAINALVAAAFNFKKWMRTEGVCSFFAKLNENIQTRPA